MGLMHGQRQASTHITDRGSHRTVVSAFLLGEIGILVHRFRTIKNRVQLLQSRRIGVYHVCRVRRNDHKALIHVLRRALYAELVDYFTDPTNTWEEATTTERDRGRRERHRLRMTTALNLQREGLPPVARAMEIERTATEKGVSTIERNYFPCSRPRSTPSWRISWRSFTVTGASKPDITSEVSPLVRMSAGFASAKCPRSWLSSAIR